MTYTSTGLTVEKWCHPMCSRCELSQRRARICEIYPKGIPAKYLRKMDDGLDVDGEAQDCPDYKRATNPRRWTPPEWIKMVEDLEAEIEAKSITPYRRLTGGIAMWKHYTFENATPLRSFIEKHKQYWQGKTIDAFYVAYSRQSHNSWRRVGKYYFEDLSYAFIVGEHAVIVRYFFDSELTLDIVDAKLLRDEAWLRSTDDSFPAEWKSRAIIWRIDAFPYLHTPISSIDIDTVSTDDAYFTLREPLEYTPMAERLIRGDYFIAFRVRFANGHIMCIDNRSMVRANRYQTFPATGYSKQEIYAEVDQHIASYLEYDFSRKVLLADPLFDVETTIVNSEVYGTYLRNSYADFYHSDRRFTEDDIRDMIEYAEFLAHALRSNIMQVDALGMGEWLQIMKANFPSVWYNKLDPAQEKSWHATFKTLKSALKQLPAYHDLTIVFEYVLPTRPAKSKKALYSQIGVRADVMLISKGKVGIIEFKDRPLKSYTDISVVSKQANKYATRIKRFHSMSQNMTVSTVALMLQDEQLCRFDKDTNVKFYSPDDMTDALVYLVGRNPACNPNPEQWLRSEWILVR